MATHSRWRRGTFLQIGALMRPLDIHACRHACMRCPSHVSVKSTTGMSTSETSGSGAEIQKMGRGTSFGKLATATCSSKVAPTIPTSRCVEGPRCSLAVLVHASCLTIAAVNGRGCWVLTRWFGVLQINAELSAYIDRVFGAHPAVAAGELATP